MMAGNCKTRLQPVTDYDNNRNTGDKVVVSDVYELILSWVPTEPSTGTRSL